MARITAKQKEVIKRCQASMSWFLRNFGKLKHPSAGIISFYPFKYQRRAIQAFRKHKLNIFRKCVAEGTPIWTPRGPVNIENIKPGELIYCYDEELKIVTTSTVKNAWSNGDRDTLEIRTKTGHRSLVTKDHPILTQEGWKNAEDITTNDILVEVHDQIRYAKGNELDAILLGYLITDGSYSRIKRKDFHFTNTCWRYLLEFQRVYEIKFGIRIPIKIHNKANCGKSKKNAYRITSTSINAKEWLQQLDIYGDKSHTKKIPEVVFKWSNREIAILLNRLFAGDGWYSGKHCNEVGIGSQSIHLLNQIKQLLTRFNIDCKIYPQSKTSIAKLRIFGTGNFYRFKEQIGIFNKQVKHAPKTEGFFRNRIKGQVKSVKPAIKMKVYDIEVEKHHNFIADGVVMHNCRQAGASKIAGAYALWFAMFHSHKTILIVSRRDEDAMSFLREQIVFLFEHLPEWMKEAWKPVKQNEHEIMFPNGSRIQSLTSHPDVLRSNASSLNIIDEAAFIQGMDAMWAGGWPTLQHGGNVIVISTTNGVGGWYWSNCTSAEAGTSMFNPIVINWYDMDWVIEYYDEISKEKKRIAPTDGIRKCTTKEEILKYGEYWSPWLEDQYKALADKGEAWKFDQEILASFVGSGNTVMPKEVLAHIALTVKDPVQKIRGSQQYVHPVTGEVEELVFDFDEPEEGLWIWEKPVLAIPEKRQGNQIIQQSQAAHPYVMGIDTATGKGKDFHAIVVFDVYTRQQVAEFMARCLPRELVKYIDRIGRYYNSALAVIERNNGGDIVIDELRHAYMYPRLWRRKDINDKPQPPGRGGRRKARALKVGAYGFATTLASKPTLNQYMLNNIRDNSEEGYTIYSRRLLKQFNTYVRKRDRLGHDTTRTEAEEGVGNYDDLVIACALGLVGTADSFVVDAGNMTPFGGNATFKESSGPTILSNEQSANLQENWAIRGGPSLMMPMALAPDELPETAAQRVLDSYTLQLGGIPISQGKPLVTPPKFFYSRGNSTQK